MKKEELINYVLANDDLDPITSACAEYLHCPLVVIAKSLAIISYSNTFIIPDFPWQNAVKRGYITLEFGTALNNWEYLRDQNNPMDCITVNEISQYRRRFYKLTYCNHFVGYLNIGELDRNFDGSQKKILIWSEESLPKKFLSEENSSSRPAQMKKY